MKLSILSDKIPWFGKYSGYECLPNYLNESINTTKFNEIPTVKNKLLGKFYQKYKGINERPEKIVSEINFIKEFGKFDAAHILYLEGHIHTLNSFKSTPSNLVGSIHIPYNLWPEKNLEILAKIDHAIILYKEDIGRFSNYISKDKLEFILHGVDIDFFKPSEQLNINKQKVLFVGHYLRNFKMMAEVYSQITTQINNDIEFHFIVPLDFRNKIVELNGIADNANVFFHEKLSDEELLSQYQTSYVMIMPMDESGANTAIVQAISVGLPVITTDVGGIRSYGGGSVFEIVENTDSKSMVELFSRYYHDENYRNKIALDQRKFAIDELDWIKIGDKHLKLYNHIRK